MVPIISGGLAFALQAAAQRLLSDGQHVADDLERGHFFGQVAARPHLKAANPAPCP
jgi:hypothetical protein